MSTYDHLKNVGKAIDYTSKIFNASIPRSVGPISDRVINNRPPIRPPIKMATKSVHVKAPVKSGTIGNVSLQKPKPPKAPLPIDFVKSSEELLNAKDKTENLATKIILESYLQINPLFCLTKEEVAKSKNDLNDKIRKIVISVIDSMMKVIEKKNQFTANYMVEAMMKPIDQTIPLNMKNVIVAVTSNIMASFLTEINKDLSIKVSSIVEATKNTIPEQVRTILETSKSSVKKKKTSKVNSDTLLINPSDEDSNVPMIYVYSSKQFIKENMFKIGIVNSYTNKSVSSRLRQLNNSNPDGFFVRTWKSPHALYVEPALHKFFKLRLDHGKTQNTFHKNEWMIIDSEELAIEYVDSTINYFDNLFNMN